MSGGIWQGGRYVLQSTIEDRMRTANERVVALEALIEPARAAAEYLECCAGISDQQFAANLNAALEKVE